MRFACLTTVAPGASLAAQCAQIAAAGCAGAETLVFPSTPLEAWQAEFGRACADAGLAPAVVILGGLALFQPGQLPWLREALHAIAELGAAALLTPEYRAQDPLPLFPPFAAPPAHEQALVYAALGEAGASAARRGVQLLFEPLTQFEGRFWRDVASALAACRRLAAPHVGLALDFHNMNISEANLVASIVAAGSYVAHVHLADSNRRLPGQGHIDFAAGLAALHEVGYSGWYSFECAVEGDFAAELGQTMRALSALAATSAHIATPITAPSTQENTSLSDSAFSAALR